MNKRRGDSKDKSRKSRSLVAWRENLRRALKNSKVLNKVLGVGRRCVDGQVCIKCPHTEGQFLTLDIANGVFECGCGYKGGGDIFAFIMHLENLTFAQALDFISVNVKIMSPAQNAKQQYKRRRKKISEEAEAQY